MWTADKLIYRNEDDFIRAYQGSELVWEKSIPNNTIYYTSTDGQVVTPYNLSVGFGANIVSNTYTNNQGVILFDGPVNKVGYQVFFDTNIRTVTLPYGVLSIGTTSFALSDLEEINIPYGVTIINDDAFWDTNITSIVIPETVTHIGVAAFGDCVSLSEVIIDAVNPPSMRISIEDTYSQFLNNAPGRKIKVPAASLQAYKTATGWSDYAADIIAQD